MKKSSNGSKHNNSDHGYFCDHVFLVLETPRKNNLLFNFFKQSVDSVKGGS